MMFAGIGWSTLINPFMNYVTRAAAALVGFIIRLVINMVTSRAMTPNLTGDWFDGGSTGNYSPYNRTMAVALILMVIFVVAAIVQAIIRGETNLIVRTLALDVPFAVFCMAFALVALQLVVDISEQMSQYFLDGANEQITGFLFWISDLPDVAGGQFFIMLLVAIITFAAGVWIWFLLLMRIAMLYVVVAFLPFVFAAMVWPALRQSMKKSIEILMGIIFTKTAIAISISVGAFAMGSVTGYTNRLAEGDNQFAAVGDKQEIIFTAGSRRVFHINDKKFGAEVAIDDADLQKAKSDGKEFNKDSCAVIKRSKRAQCNLSLFQENSDGPVIVDGDRIFRVHNVGKKDEKRYLIGRIGKKLVAEAGSSGFSLVPVDMTTAELRGDKDPRDRDSTEPYSRLITLDDDIMSQIVFGITGSVAGSTGRWDDAAGTGTRVEQASGLDQNASNRLFQYFNCGLDGAQLPEDFPLESLVTGDYAAGCLKTQADGEDIDNDADTPEEKTGVWIDDDGDLHVAGRVIGTLQDGEDSADITVLLVGAAVLVMSAFSPFILLRLFPILDLAVLAGAADRPFSRVGTHAMNINSVISFGQRFSKNKGQGQGAAPDKEKEDPENGDDPDLPSDGGPSRPGLGGGWPNGPGGAGGPGGSGDPDGGPRHGRGGGPGGTATPTGSPEHRSTGRAHGPNNGRHRGRSGRGPSWASNVVVPGKDDTPSSTNIDVTVSGSASASASSSADASARAAAGEGSDNGSQLDLAQMAVQEAQQAAARASNSALEAANAESASTKESSESRRLAAEVSSSSDASSAASGNGGVVMIPVGAGVGAAGAAGAAGVGTRGASAGNNAALYGASSGVNAAGFSAQNTNPSTNKVVSSSAPMNSGATRGAPQGNGSVSGGSSAPGISGGASSRTAAIGGAPSGPATTSGGTSTPRTVSSSQPVQSNPMQQTQRTTSSPLPANNFVPSSAMATPAPAMRTTTSRNIPRSTRDAEASRAMSANVPAKLTSSRPQVVIPARPAGGNLGRSPNSLGGR